MTSAATGATTTTIVPPPGLQEELVGLRHALHRCPEIGLQLPQTQSLVLKALRGLNLEITCGKSVTSVTAVLRGSRPGPVVLLRADMDALPVVEATGLPFASTNGAMHACGHDMHTAMLVGAAKILALHVDELAGDVVLMFQPGEEGWDGAGAMLREGVLEAAGQRVDAAFALHVSSNRLPNGVFTSRPGTLLAASSRLTVKVRGRGTHGSTPHYGRDPITAAAAVITSLQTQVTRQFDIFDPVVVTVGAISGGTRANVIADEATFEATVRTFSAANLAQVETMIAAVCDGAARMHDLDVDVDFHHEYPMTSNDPEQFEFLARTVTDVFGANRFAIQPNPTPGSEDFSRVLQAVPGCYVQLGATVHPDAADSASNHSPLAAFDDNVLVDGALLHAELAVRTLARAARPVQ